MVSKSRKQHQLMLAVAHGWRPRRYKGPTPEVAREFLQADKAAGKYQGRHRRKHRAQRRRKYV